MKIYHATSVPDNMFYPYREFGQNLFENKDEKFLTPYAYNTLRQIEKKRKYNASWATLCNGNRIYVVHKKRYYDFCTTSLYGFMGDYLIQIVAPNELAAKAIYSLFHKKGIIGAICAENNFCFYARENLDENFTPYLDIKSLQYYFTIKEFNEAIVSQSLD